MPFILVAEDEPEIAAVLSEVIGEHLGATTHVVANGALVPEVIAERRPDLLVLDVSLPGLSGLDVFDLVRSDAAYSGVAVLFLTASPEKAEAAFSLTGTHRVVAKPFDVDELVAIVGEMLETSTSAEVAA